MIKKVLFLLVGIVASTALRAIDGHMPEFHGVKDNVDLTIIPYDKDEILVNSRSWKLRVADFLRGGYIPVRVSIENKGGKIISISDASIRNFDLDKGIHEMAKSLEYSQIGSTLFWWTLRSIPCCVWMIGAWLQSMRYVVFYSHLSKETESEKRTRREAQIFWLRIASLGLIGLGINTFVGIPYDWVKLQFLNDHLLPHELKKTLCTGSITIMPGARVEKIFVLPDWKCILYEFQIFDQWGRDVMTEFMVMRGQELHRTLVH